MWGHNIRANVLAERISKNIMRFARWILDTSRKEDFDIPLISISTRLYRSEGGISHVTASLLFYGEVCHTKDSIELVHRDFYGEDIASLKQEVEEWAREQIQKLACTSLYAFAEDAHDIWKAESRMADMEKRDASV